MRHIKVFGVLLTLCLAVVGCNPDAPGTPCFSSGYEMGDCDRDGFVDPEYMLGGTDCDDSDPAVNPDATEVCNGLDDNCDGEIDEGFEPCDPADNDTAE